MRTTKIMPPTWLLITIITMLALHFLIPVAWIIPPLWNLAGVILIASGLTLNLRADKAFHAAHTTVKPFEESSSLVTNGVFRISRNPMYLGFVLILTGIAILLRTLSPYLVISAFVVILDKTYVRVEERMLAEKFGASWKHYQSMTRRWL
jgi:protein-S-isoprenylcysteine O-methyltransferase Ste14